jgi:hypothetical protein
MSAEDEAALRAVDGRAVPWSQRAEQVRHRVANALGSVFEPPARKLAATLDARPPLRPAAAALHRRPWLLVAAPVLALVLGLLIAAAAASLARPSGVDSEALARIERGEAKAVLGELEKLPLAQRTARDELLRGHALTELERSDEALVAYRAAAGLGVFDDKAVRLALAQLSREEASAAVDLLVQVPSTAVTRLLLEASRHDEWKTRHNAVLALVARGEADKVDMEALAIRDLLEGPTCVLRRQGLLDLKEHGKSEAARGAFQKAYARKDSGNGCMRRELEDMAPK